MSKIVHISDDRSLGGVSRLLETLLSSALGFRFAMDLKTTREALRCDSDEVAAFIVHEPGSWSRIWTLKRLPRRRPVVVVEHHYSRCFEQRKVPSSSRFRAMLRCYYAQAEVVVAVSESQKNWMLESDLVGPEKVRVISPAVDLSRFLELPSELWTADRPLRLGAYGRFDEQKGFVELLKELTSRREIPLRLRIGGYGPLQGRLRELAAGDSRIEILGRISDPVEFLAETDLVVIPSLWEPYGLIGLEARAAGKPVLVSSADALPEQARGCGAVFRETAEIHDLLSGWTPHRLETLARNARCSVFSALESRLDRWADLFVDLTPSSIRP